MNIGDELQIRSIYSISHDRREEIRFPYLDEPPFVVYVYLDYVFYDSS